MTSLRKLVLAFALVLITMTLNLSCSSSDGSEPVVTPEVSEEESTKEEEEAAEEEESTEEESTEEESTEEDESTGEEEETSDPDESSESNDACKIVHFVYFVEKDEEYNEEDFKAIEQRALDFQQYWFDQLGVTFYLNDPIVEVIEADQNGDWYVETVDGIHTDPRWYRLGNIKKEVYSKLGIEDFDPDHRVVNYPISIHNGRVGANFGGAWMDGDDLGCISGRTKSIPYDEEFPAGCMDHVAHEFGHVLGLAHTGPETDCMQQGFYEYSGAKAVCGFSAKNTSDILFDPDNEGWLNAKPGETCQTGS